MLSSPQDVVILAPTTAAASSTGGYVNVPAGFRGAIVHLNVSAASGTSPTLNVYVQEQLKPAAATDALLDSPPTGTAYYDDFISFTQATGTGKWIARVGGPGATNVVAANKDASLTAGSVANGPIGNVWRVKYVITGTNPSFTFSVSARLLP